MFFIIKLFSFDKINFFAHISRHCIWSTNKLVDSYEIILEMTQLLHVGLSLSSLMTNSDTCDWEIEKFGNQDKS